MRERVVPMMVVVVAAMAFFFSMERWGDDEEEEEEEKEAFLLLLSLPGSLFRFSLRVERDRNSGTVARRKRKRAWPALCCAKERDRGASQR